jgi:NAD(P)-dependent dehydrogenase (short-subunit alcohol dehydrogenase family)
MMVFSGKSVVVTGVGSGIGRAIAAGFCADGASVTGIGRNRRDLEETARLCKAGCLRFVVGDVARPEDVEQLFTEAVHAFGKVDILVNNAALYPKIAFLESTHEEWSRVFQTNVVGLAHCCRMALPGMLERGYGRIVNLGSLAWMGPIANSSAYSASKGAVRVLTRALATEIDRDRYPDVLINELLPGIVRTRMSESGLDPKDVYPHARFVAGLPRNGPSGKTFMRSALFIEDYRLRARVRRLISRFSLGLVRNE